ncbi:MAG: 30S ribosomal protein S17 [Bdellovibrionaceae bacterium]|nr:30S ribosomal protein S17 [Pseudobdellovibrionaceae bacterium]
MSVVGEVVSDKMDKSISVKVYRTVKHKKYHKYTRLSSVFKAHDEKNMAKAGDQVKIIESRPISKTKKWRLVEILEK